MRFESLASSASLALLPIHLASVCIKRCELKLGMVVLAFNINTQEAEAVRSLYEAILAYAVSFRLSGAT